MRHSISRKARGAVAALAVLLPACTGSAQGEEQALVDRSTLTVQEMLGPINGGGAQADAVALLQKARAVMVCPRIFRAGFIVGGQGGSCVLLARDGAGSWSSPAFYNLGAGSIGFQIGVQDAQVMMMILTNKGLGALLDSQFKIGADASVAVATIGGGIAGATTAAVGADIVTVARARGLYAGISLDGSIMGSNSEANRAYYGQNYSARQIVIDMAAHNPGADPLRGMLIRFGATSQPAAATPQTPAGQQPMGNYQPPSYPQGVQATPLR
ncbi:lipid-binding SYLF domain-containing protein [Roseomonas marmotae]|uniref:Lipid-binding SYLF domain-containing protein n=1 Tax=Roseomonas marmotae TaxID=2768161 RepID=A0ABS3KFS0_9PROT|nr:lipid-binding SYLF domain-containing protein [Roseomonas marmotae]MBO1075785.1 lipid-binding SYLF domain-containing protein [Roseomonas marmotae]QTI80510.1 lipid-binding SYLF domain-containing protein [Roseomonas marmotae]